MQFSILSIQKRKLYILASEIEAKTERRESYPIQILFHAFYRKRVWLSEANPAECRRD